MASVAFATYRDQPGISRDDAPVADALGRAGVHVTPVVWDDHAARWSVFDAVVLRSTWDYFRKPDQFARWVRSFSAPGSRLLNPPEVVLWNIDKRYLLDLAARRIDVVPTEYLTANDRQELHVLLERRGWSEAVVKPAIGAGSHGAWRTSLGSLDQARLSEQLSTQDVLVQAYMPEVASTGEWSLVFFGREYSHAVLKLPRDGDFRVQEHLGGRSMRADPGPDLVRQARDVVDAVGQPLLYARVDGVVREGRLFVMELEIIEPFLFIGLAPGTAHRFADAISRALRK